MTVFALFHGGANYGPGGLEDLEEFSSLQAVQDTLRARYRGYDSYYPCVTESAYMDVFLARPEDGDLCPDRRYSIGPRGGVSREL